MGTHKLDLDKPSARLEDLTPDERELAHLMRRAQQAKTLDKAQGGVSSPPPNAPKESQR